jgi:hypothetical protein
MHPELVDELDEGFSPMDGIQAINDVFVGLPLVHRSKSPKCRRARKTLRLYRGRFSWYRELWFSYVEIGNELHVLELWSNSDRDSVPDVALPETELQRHGGDHDR